MGFCANSVECDFVIPADKVSAALAAVNAVLFDESASSGVTYEGGYESLSEALEDRTCFMDCEEDAEKGFILGYHCDKWLGGTDELLDVLGKFATEGSYVRCVGEDDCLFGFRVVDGRTHSETGNYVWTLDKEYQR